MNTNSTVYNRVQVVIMMKGIINSRSIIKINGSRYHRNVGNQQKWDTFVEERSGGYGSVVGLPEQVVVEFAAG